MDIYSGTIDNSVGKVIQMDRAKVNDDPQHTCSAGLHVCANEYLDGYANAASTKTLVVEVNPAHVVAVPYDYNFAKMRVCEYKVVAEIDPKTIPEVLDSEMYGDCEFEYVIEDDFNEPEFDEEHEWEVYYNEEQEELDTFVADDVKCGDSDCWCVDL